ncbi:MAG: hypothetical protein V7L20_14595 [Nostoc sp.]|uniref:hypothetical protein n=1 Tax=Nostoc sp. TaxID=1180 RepID=UPI002FF5FEF4
MQSTLFTTLTATEEASLSGGHKKKTTTPPTTTPPATPPAPPTITVNLAAIITQTAVNVNTGKVKGDLTQTAVNQIKV